jgi:hypothetical protein
MHLMWTLLTDFAIHVMHIGAYLSGSARLNKKPRLGAFLVGGSVLIALCSRMREKKRLGECLVIRVANAAQSHHLNGLVLCCQPMLQKDTRRAADEADSLSHSPFICFIVRSHFDNSPKQVSNAEAPGGGGELFEKFQQKQKNNIKEGTNSMGGKR